MLEHDLTCVRFGVKEAYVLLTLGYRRECFIACNNMYDKASLELLCILIEQKHYT